MRVYEARNDGILESHGGGLISIFSDALYSTARPKDRGQLDLHGMHNNTVQSHIQLHAGMSSPQ